MAGLALALGLAGSAALALGCWIPVKAELAQILIGEAWKHTRAGEREVRPWPWADTWPVARIVLPTMRRGPNHRQAFFALAGASGESLAFGPAHVSSSGAPGEADNVVFAGHRDTHFRSLRWLEPGDLIEVESPTQVTRYRVESGEVVHESSTDRMARSGLAELTLITCYPFDALVPGGPLRYVVHAIRVTNDRS